MKIFIENSDKNINALKGKSLFCKRLADIFKLKGIEVTGSLESKTDVSLNVIRIKHKNSAKKILRLDNVWHDTAKLWRKKNRSLQEALKQADGVVYQSEFAKNMCDKFLGEADCPSAVIFNGSNPLYYKEMTPIKESYRHVFLAFSKWRPHKRLRDIIKSFLLAEIPDSILIVAGSLDRSGIDRKDALKYFSRFNTRWIGMVDQSILASYLKIARASIHLCWFDACPNSVVEAIVAGVPVITNNTGGTFEIVGPSGGYVLYLDEPYDFKPVDLYNPPPIDRQRVVEAMWDCIEEPPIINCEHVDIKNIADQYINFIKKVCNG
ncbi:MAG: glycosyltransferase family 4 protein [Promethearchaeota archaeon]|jgi:glycosyltransferase involved in cell wall biosynthesis